MKTRQTEHHNAARFKWIKSRFEMNALEEDAFESRDELEVFTEYKTAKLRFRQFNAIRVIAIEQSRLSKILLEDGINEGGGNIVG